MPAARLCACSGSAWLRPDDVDAIPTRRALPSKVGLLGSALTHTRACALRRLSVAREPSLSLESQQAVGALHVQSPLLWCLDVLAFGPDGGEEGVGQEREGYVPVPAN